MVNALYLKSAFLVLMTTQTLYSMFAIHTHFDTVHLCEALCHTSFLLCWDTQFGVQYHAQGHPSMQKGGSNNRTSG